MESSKKQKKQYKQLMEMKRQRIQETKNDFHSSIATNNVLAYVIEECKVNKPSNGIQLRLNNELRTKNFIPNLKNNCLVCAKSDVTKRCGKCHAVFYCDRSCALLGWPKHKLYCGRNLFTVCVCCGQPDIRLLRSMRKNPPSSAELEKLPLFKVCEKCPVIYCSDKCWETFHTEHEKDCADLAELQALCKQTQLPLSEQTGSLSNPIKTDETNNNQVNECNHKECN